MVGKPEAMMPHGMRPGLGHHKLGPRLDHPRMPGPGPEGTWPATQTGPHQGDIATSPQYPGFGPRSQSQLSPRTPSPFQATSPGMQPPRMSPLTMIPPPPVPPVPPPGGEVGPEYDRQQFQYEDWLTKQAQFLDMQIKLLDQQIAKQKRTKKSIQARQRQARKNGNELNPNDVAELERITTEQSGLQKQLEALRKQHRQHQMMVQDYRNKQKEQMSRAWPSSPAPTHSLAHSPATSQGMMSPQPSQASPVSTPSSTLPQSPVSTQASTPPQTPPIRTAGSNSVRLTRTDRQEYEAYMQNRLRMLSQQQGTSGMPLTGPRIRLPVPAGQIPPGQLPPGQVPPGGAGAQAPAPGGPMAPGQGPNSASQAGARLTTVLGDNNPFSEDFQQREQLERFREKNRAQIEGPAGSDTPAPAAAPEGLQAPIQPAQQQGIPAQIQPPPPQGLPRMQYFRERAMAFDQGPRFARAPGMYAGEGAPRPFEGPRPPAYPGAPGLFPQMPGSDQSRLPFPQGLPFQPGFGIPPTANLPPEMGSQGEKEKPKKRRKKKKPAESENAQSQPLPPSIPTQAAILGQGTPVTTGASTVVTTAPTAPTPTAPPSTAPPKVTEFPIKPQSETERRILEILSNTAALAQKEGDEQTPGGKSPRGKSPAAATAPSPLPIASPQVTGSTPPGSVGQQLPVSASSPISDTGSVPPTTVASQLASASAPGMESLQPPQAPPTQILAQEAANMSSRSPATTVEEKQMPETLQASAITSKPSPTVHSSSSPEKSVIDSSVSIPHLETQVSQSSAEGQSTQSYESPPHLQPQTDVAPQEPVISQAPAPTQTLPSSPATETKSLTETSHSEKDEPLTAKDDAPTDKPEDGAYDEPDGGGSLPEGESSGEPKKFVCDDGIHCGTDDEEEEEKGKDEQKAPAKEKFVCDDGIHCGTDDEDEAPEGEKEASKVPVEQSSTSVTEQTQTSQTESTEQTEQTSAHSSTSSKPPSFPVPEEAGVPKDVEKHLPSEAEQIPEQLHDKQVEHSPLQKDSVSPDDKSPPSVTSSETIPTSGVKQVSPPSILSTDTPSSVSDTVKQATDSETSAPSAVSSSQPLPLVTEPSSHVNPVVTAEQLISVAGQNISESASVTSTVVAPAPALAPTTAPMLAPASTTVPTTALAPTTAPVPTVPQPNVSQGSPRLGVPPGHQMYRHPSPLFHEQMLRAGQEQQPGIIQPVSTVEMVVSDSSLSQSQRLPPSYASAIMSSHGMAHPRPTLAATTAGSTLPTQTGVPIPDTGPRQGAGGPEHNIPSPNVSQPSRALVSQLMQAGLPQSVSLPGNMMTLSSAVPSTSVPRLSHPTASTSVTFSNNSQSTQPGHTQNPQQMPGLQAPQMTEQQIMMPMSAAALQHRAQMARMQGMHRLPRMIPPRMTSHAQTLPSMSVGQRLPPHSSPQGISPQSSSPGIPPNLSPQSAAQALPRHASPEGVPKSVSQGLSPGQHQGMPVYSSGQGMPPHGVQGQPPISAAQAMPPHSVSQGLPPRAIQGMPPRSVAPGMPPQGMHHFAQRGMPPQAMMHRMAHGGPPGMPPHMMQRMPQRMPGQRMPPHGIPGMQHLQSGMPPRLGMPPHSTVQGMPPNTAHLHSAVQGIPASGMPPQAHAGMPHSTIPGMPPHSMAQGLPPHSAAPGLPPHSAAPGMPPHSAAPGMPPHSVAQGMPPHSVAQGMPPHSVGQGMPPHSVGQGMPPHSVGQGISPHTVGQGMPPHTVGQGMPPHSAPGLPPHTSLQGMPLHMPQHGTSVHASATGVPPHSTQGLPPHSTSGGTLLSAMQSQTASQVPGQVRPPHPMPLQIPGQGMPPHSIPGSQTMGGPMSVLSPLNLPTKQTPPTTSPSTSSATPPQTTSAIATPPQSVTPATTPLSSSQTSPAGSLSALAALSPNDGIKIKQEPAEDIPFPPEAGSGDHLELSADEAALRATQNALLKQLLANSGAKKGAQGEGEDIPQLTPEQQQQLEMIDKMPIFRETEISSEEWESKTPEEREKILGEYLMEMRRQEYERKRKEYEELRKAKRKTTPPEGGPEVKLKRRKKGESKDGVTKKRIRKPKGKESELEARTESFLQQLRALPPINLQEPPIGINNNIVPVLAANTHTAESQLRGSYGKAYIEGLPDFYGSLQHPNFPMGIRPPAAEIAARRRFLSDGQHMPFTDEQRYHLLSAQALGQGLSHRMPLLPGMMRPFLPALPPPPRIEPHLEPTARDTPDTVISSSSPEVGFGEQESELPALRPIDPAVDDDDRGTSPAVPLLHPVPIKPEIKTEKLDKKEDEPLKLLEQAELSVAEKKERSIDSLAPGKETLTAKMPALTSSLARPFMDPSLDQQVSVTLTLSATAAEDIGGVISAIADLLKIAVPPTYEMTRSPSPETFKMNLTHKEEAVNIQSLIKAKPKFCRHCDVVVLSSGIRKKKTELPFLTKDEQDSEDEEVTFCSMNCYMQFTITHQMPPQLHETEGGNLVEHKSGCTPSTSPRHIPVTSALSISTTPPITPQSSKEQPATPTTPLSSSTVSKSPMPSPALPSPPVKLKEEKAGKKHRRSSSTASDVQMPQVQPVKPLVKKWKDIRWQRWDPKLGDSLGQHSPMPTKELDSIWNRLDMVIHVTKTIEDVRRCTLCLEASDGDTDSASRLLNMDVDKWVHLNCALWSYEVYETLNGALMNVDVAFKRGSGIECVICGRLGATLSCFKLRCTHTYHLPCAKRVRCMFFQDKTLLCPLHAPKGPIENELESLVVFRRVYINRDEDKQVASMIHQDEGSHTLRVGSLILHSIGQLLPHQIQTGRFHTKDYIFPVGFRTSRFYWSMRQLYKRCRYTCSISDNDGRPEFVIKIIEEGFQDVTFRESSPRDAWMHVLQPIEKIRRGAELVKMFPSFITGEELFGLTEPNILKVLESLPGTDLLGNYCFRYGRSPLIEMPLAINPTGCARTEPKLRTHFKRRPHTLQSSNSRSLPTTVTGVTGDVNSPYMKQFVHSKSQQYRRLKTEWKTNVFLARSGIQGLGLFAARDLEKHTMVIEYIGDLIRNEVANRRETVYEEQNRGVYMFRIDCDTVIDATMAGGPARYINHSCAPNCVAEVVPFEKESKIIIITSRRIAKGEELTYDYKFDFEDDQHKIPCNCGATGCRKWMN